MPRFKITYSFPEKKNEILEKFIFTQEEELKNTIIPRYRKMDLIIHEVSEAPSVYDQQVLQARLDSGLLVDLGKFSFHLTYSELIEGDPDQWYNESVLERLQTKFSPDFVPTHIRRPSEKQIQGELPVFYGIAEWKRYKGIQDTGSSSELRVIWFMDSVAEGLTFPQMLQESLMGLDWDQLAQEYDPGSL